MWLNTASAEEDQHLLLHHCLFSPANRFVHVVGKWQEHKSMQNPNDKDAPKTTLSGTQRTVQNKKQRQFMTPLKRWSHYSFCSIDFHSDVYMNAEDRKCKLISKMFTVWFGELWPANSYHLKRSNQQKTDTSQRDFLAEIKKTQTRFVALQESGVDCIFPHFGFLIICHVVFVLKKDAVKCHILSEEMLRAQSLVWLQHNCYEYLKVLLKSRRVNP